MLDGQIDYDKYDDSQLLDALRNIDVQQYPINYGRLKAALAARNYLVREHGSERIAFSEPAKLREVSARFSPGRGPLAWIEPARNDYRLIGAGQLLVGPHVVRMRARRLSFLIGFALQHVFELNKESITDVEHGSNMVRFVYRERGRKPKALTFWVQDAATAAELASRLPLERSAEFQPLLPTQVEFEDDLRRRGEALYFQTQRWLARLETVAIARQDQIWEHVRNDTLDDDGVAEALESSVLPVWREAERRLSRIELEPESRVRPNLTYLKTFAASRRKAFE